MPIDTNLRDALLESNPWWAGRFFDIEVRDRAAFAVLGALEKKKQITAIYWLRRTGKSFALYHVAKKRLERGTDPKATLYFSFDDFPQARLKDIIDSATVINGGTRPSCLLLDEIQKMAGWQEQVKREYDLHGTKMFVTGSETLFLKKGAKESLAGRVYEMRFEALSFGEFLAFRGIDAKRMDSARTESELERYLYTGGFPELAGEADLFFIRKYIKEGIIDKAIFRELPARAGIDDPSLLERMMARIASNPGILIDKNSLAADMGCSRVTAARYLFYLESAFLITSLFNYSRNQATSGRKLKKYYPGFSCLAVYGGRSDPVFFSKFVETCCALKTGARFFWRNPQKDEVDMVLTDPLRPVEVKYQNDIHGGDFAGLEKFRGRFGAKKGLIITKNDSAGRGWVSAVPFRELMLQG